MEETQNKKGASSWAYAIIVVFVLFAVFIGQFVYRSVQNPTNLVAENYYQQEIDFQTKIDKSSNALAIKDQMTFAITDELVTVDFPTDWETVKGTLHLYNPMNEKLDVSMPFTTQSNVLKMKLKDLQAGKWVVKLDFDYGNKGYFLEENVIVK